MYWQRLYLQPLNFGNSHLLEVISAQVVRMFGYSCTRTQNMPLPQSAYDQSRDQYCSPYLLKVLGLHLPADALRLLGITDSDIYVPQFNYVFGQAAVGGKYCIISTHRLHPEFYGEPQNDELFENRSVKEAVHELGHTFNLRHCSDDQCVMRFSNNISDTDRKSAEFCGECAERLQSNLANIRNAA